MITDVMPFVDFLDRYQIGLAQYHKKEMERGILRLKKIELNITECPVGGYPEQDKPTNILIETYLQFVYLDPCGDTVIGRQAFQRRGFVMDGYKERLLCYLTRELLDEMNNQVKQLAQNVPEHTLFWASPKIALRLNW